MTERAQTVRLAVITAGLLAVWVGLGARLAYLHLGENDRLRSRIHAIREIEQPILVGRGRILDRNGNLLAMDLAVKHVCVDPKVITESGHRTFISQQLARMLQLEPAVVQSRLSRPNRRFEYIDKFVKDDEVRQIAGMGLTGVFFEDVSQRNYPQGSLMSHVVGFSNHDGIGSAGVELKLDQYLRGVPGLRISQVDGRNRELFNRRTLEIQPQRGADVYLTLDQNLQYFVERALDSAVQKHSAKGAWAIIQEVKTGRILALANRPTFDVNQFGKVSDRERMNRAIGYVFEPGSIFKISVIAAALNEHTTDPSVVIDCENGAWHFAGRLLRDYHPYSKLTVADVLKKSSNIGSAKLAIQLGEQRVYNYLRSFGVGSPTGVDLPGEEAGILHPRSKWSKLSISRIPMGQGVSVTALQMVNMLSCMGNNGFLMRPQVVDRVVGTDGKTVLKNEPYVVSRPIRSQTAQLMCKLMARVTEEGGTGTKARVDGYTVGGKTGSAQKPVGGVYSDSAHIASFMGFLPAEQPEISIIVIVDEPQPLHTGGQVAAPVFKEIAEQAVRYLDIPPTPEEQAYRFGDHVPAMEL
jgi:cell division protein FtsI (penicillin-binding protein 3)